MIRRTMLMRSGLATAILATVCAAAFAAGNPNIAPPFSDQSAWGIDYPGNLLVRMAPVRVWDGNTFAARIFRVDGNPAHAAIAERTPMTLTGGHEYTLSVEARADTERTVQVVARTAGRHAHNIGLDQPMVIGFPYTTFRYQFTVDGVGPQKVDLAFQVGGMTGTVWVRDIKLVDDGPASATASAA